MNSVVYFTIKKCDRFVEDEILVAVNLQSNFTERKDFDCL